MGILCKINTDQNYMEFFCKFFCWRSLINLEGSSFIKYKFFYKRMMGSKYFVESKVPTNYQFFTKKVVWVCDFFFYIRISAKLKLQAKPVIILLKSEITLHLKPYTCRETNCLTQKGRTHKPQILTQHTLRARHGTKQHTVYCVWRMKKQTQAI